VAKNKKYKIGIINASTLLTYTFWIDGHELKIVSIDFVAIEPYVTSVINVGIGQ
jgi:FtsP/CotA-like multicopper oxidase with cupredoxin domain